MKNFSLMIISAVLIPLTACFQEDLYSPEVNQREYTADFMFNNNSDQNISVTYVTSSKLGFKMSDGFIVIPANSTMKIFNAVFASEFPSPSSALYSLSFYESTGSNYQILFDNKPVIDDDWQITEQSIDEDGFGYTQYQLSYSNVISD